MQRTHKNNAILSIDIGYKNLGYTIFELVYDTQCGKQHVDTLDANSDIDVLNANNTMLTTVVNTECEHNCEQHNANDNANTECEQSTADNNVNQSIQTRIVKHKRLHKIVTKDSPLYKQQYEQPTSNNTNVNNTCNPQHKQLTPNTNTQSLSYSQFMQTHVLTLSNIIPHFDIFNITEHTAKLKLNVVESRCIAINTFFEDIAKQYSIVRIIIEKQVPNNTIAMELMYSIYTKALQYCEHKDVIIFDPKLKFSSINEPYDTKNKKHKKQSIMYAGNLIKNSYPSMLEQFNSHPKKDDIADAFNMLIIDMITKNEVNIDFTQLRRLYGL